MNELTKTEQVAFVLIFASGSVVTFATTLGRAADRLIETRAKHTMSKSRARIARVYLSSDETGLVDISGGDKLQS